MWFGSYLSLPFPFYFSFRTLTFDLSPAPQVTGNSILPLLSLHHRNRGKYVFSLEISLGAPAIRGMASLAWIHAFGLVDLPLLRLNSLLSCLAIFSARQIYCPLLTVKNGRQDDRSRRIRQRSRHRQRHERFRMELWPMGTGTQSKVWIWGSL